MTKKISYIQVNSKQRNSALIAVFHLKITVRPSTRSENSRVSFFLGRRSNQTYGMVEFYYSSSNYRTSSGRDLLRHDWNFVISKTCILNIYAPYKYRRKLAYPTCIFWVSLQYPCNPEIKCTMVNIFTTNYPVHN